MQPDEFFLCPRLASCSPGQCPPMNALHQQTFTHLATGETDVHSLVFSYLLTLSLMQNAWSLLSHIVKQVEGILPIPGI